MKRLKKFARSMAELMIAVAVIGVIIALIVGLNNTKGTNYSTATAKKNQFEHPIGERQKAMLSDPTMTAHKACDAAALRDY